MEELRAKLKGRHMKIKILAAAAVGLAALSMGSVASASPLVLGACTSSAGAITCTQTDDTISFNESVPSGTTFSSTVNFTNTAAGLYEIILESTTSGFNFTSVSVNGSSAWTGTSHLVDLSGISIGANLADNVTFTGTTTNAAGDTGSISFSLRAVPEPATWAMMLLGFAGIGFAMRRRGSTQALAQIA